MPKAPPRLPPPPLPRSYRVYAQVRAFDVACPACHTVMVVGGRRLPGTRKHVIGRRRRAGYDQASGILTCRGCHRPWYVGLVLWRLLPGVRARPEDHVPTPAEADQLRGWGKGSEERKGGRAAGVNLVCWCGLECPAHPKEDGDVIDG